MRDQTTRRWFFGVAWALVAYGCDAGGPSPEPESICPACEPHAGGETTSFGESPCEQITERVPIEASAADALGYDTASLLARIRQPIDEELTWDALPTASGGPASAYATRTRVKAELTTGALVHARPDPALCDGSSCAVRGGTEIRTCTDRLHVEIGLTFRTADGSIAGTASGEVVQWNEATRDVVRAPAHPTGYAKVDLRDVEGALQLDPPTGVDYVGLLAAEVTFEADGRTHGTLQPRVTYLVFSDGGDDELHAYEPLRGTW